MKIFVYFTFICLSIAYYNFANGKSIGQSTGYELPRYVSLKSNESNLRVGASKDYPKILTYIIQNFPIEITISAISWQNSIMFSGIIRNISERKQMEQELIKNQVKLEESNKLLQKISTEDALTLIPNRRFFDNFLHGLLKHFHLIY